MAKGLKRGNGGKINRKPLSEDARKMKNVNELQKLQALSWTLEEEHGASQA